MKKAIGIKVKKAEGEYDLSLSKFFGVPTIPGEWIDEFSDGEMFLCQIRCSDLAELDTECRLPHTGYLYVFLDISVYPYVSRVMYYDGEPDTAVECFNDVVDGAEHLTEEWLMSFESVDEDAEGIKLLGVPSEWEYEEAPPRVFLQYDPLQEYMGFLDSMDGFAYLFYGEDTEDFESIYYREERS